MPVQFRLCAARTANKLNVEGVVRDLELPRTTVSTYLTHLRSVFVIHLLPAWSRNLTSKAVHRPKLLVADTGLAAHLMGTSPQAHKPTSPQALSDPTTPAGPLLETFVAMELRKQLGWSEEVADLYQYRDRGGAQVDLVVEADDGRAACVEVTSSATVRGGDFTSIRLFEDRLGSRFVGGVVLYTGHQSVRFGPKLAALPLARLWE